MARNVFCLLPLLALTAIPRTQCAPAVSPESSQIANTSYGPIPGESPVYSTDLDVVAPFPGNTTGAVLNTTYGPGGPDDLLFQNLLGAEWTIFSFYQQGVEKFNATPFTDLGFLTRRTSDAISSNSIKPGPCQYEYPFTGPASYLALQTAIEVASMAFVSGLEYESNDPHTAATLVAIGETETRHETWSLIDVWGASPFAGPVDTVFPYANQLLEFTKAFIVPGSCPPENPPYPNPQQYLASFDLISNTTSIAPGSQVTFNFSTPSLQPHFDPCEEYFVVFFHGIYNISAPFDTKTNTTIIPPEFEPLGTIIAVIADQEGAPVDTSVVAGPTTWVESPDVIGLGLATG